MVWTVVPTFCLFVLCRVKDEIPPFHWILGWAILFRCCGLFGGPVLEDDYFRYLWDGYQFATNGTPYGVAPSLFFSESSVPYEFQRILDQINYPDVPTIYGPTVQLLFLLGYLINPAEVIVLQSLLIVFDLVLILLLRHLVDSPTLVLYAWCPLLIKEVAFTAHPDILGICLLFAACLFHIRGSYRLVGVLLGLAVGAKIFALLFLPFLLWPGKLKVLSGFGITLALLYLPHLVQGVTDVTALLIFADQWQYNAFVYAIVSNFLDPTVSKILLGISASFFIGWLWFGFRKIPFISIPRGDWIFGVLLLVAPVINAWYVLWILPFLVLRPSRWGWTASVALLLAYINYGNLGVTSADPFTLPGYVQVTEFTLIALACVFDIRKYRLEKAS